MVTSYPIDAEDWSPRSPEVWPAKPDPLDEQALRGLVAGLEREVPRLAGRPRPAVNLDNAATTPPLREVLAGVAECAEWYASVHRGAGFKSRLSTGLYDHCHAEVARLFGADPACHTVIFTANTTHALNLVARRLRLAPGERVLSTVMEHHSNMLPWRQAGPVDYAAVHPADGTLNLDDLERKLQLHHGRVRLVAVTAASNVTGVLPPLRRIARLAHGQGAALLVDAAQLAAHHPLAMGAGDDPERIDFLCFSGHKAYAPFGAGALIGPRAFFEPGPPALAGGGTVAQVSLTDVVWARLPDKEEAGTPNVLGVWALVRALKVLERLDLNAIARHERALTARLLRRLARISGVRVFGDADPERASQRLAMVPIQVDRFPHGLLAAILSHEYAISVRHGCFCAQPYVAALLGLDEAAVADHLSRVRAGDPGEPPGFVRFSLGLYNTAEEIDYCADALEEIVRRGPRGRYRRDPASGDYLAENASFNVTDSILLP